MAPSDLPDSWLIRRPKDGAEERIPLGFETTIGRDESNEIRLDDRQISRKHAVIVAASSGGYVLSDLGSANGTFVNGRRLIAPLRLKTGSVLSFGELRLEFEERSRRSERIESSDDGGTTTSRRGSGQDALLIGRSPAMAEVFRLIGQASSTDIPVLVEGETGTGKELVARGLHQSSARASKPFSAINCAAIPESLIESELFGHRRGAFTGATTDRCGLFEAADGGTVLLDEIAEMPLAIQPKLLRVLQEGEVSRLGEAAHRRVDVRIISATNRDLLAEVEAGRFRADLYYRLSAFPIRIPPLRDRGADVVLLCEFFLSSFSAAREKRVRRFAKGALDALARFAWPGNVRELRNEIHRAVTLATAGQDIGVEHLSDKIRHPAREISSEQTELASAEGALPAPEDLRRAREAFERRHIIEVLSREGNVVARAADVLGLTRPGLHKKLKDYGLR